jgi:hypothetical protein
MGSLAVINTQGQIWSRELDLKGGTIGAGVLVAAPWSLLSVTNADQFVVASGYQNIPIPHVYIYVVTNTGVVFLYHLGTNPIMGGGLTLYPDFQLNGRAFGGSDTPDAKYVFADKDCGVYVINNAGEVWHHDVTLEFDGIVQGWKLNGPSLFGAPDDKYVVYTGSSILVVNTQGEVWAHDLTKSDPTLACPDTVGVGYKLGGPSLFAWRHHIPPLIDKYVAYYGGHLLVIDTLGEVWSHLISPSTVGAGIRLNGPGLFGGPDDKYVIAF